MTRTSYVASATLLFVLLAPLAANAVQDLSADTIDCMPKAVDEGCGPCSKLKKDSKGNCTVPDPTNKWMCQCKSKIKPVGGKCVATNNCRGEEFTDMGGKSQGMGSVGDFMKILSGLKDLFKKDDKGGGGGGGSPTSGLPTTCPDGSQPGANGQCGCTQYYQVTVPSNDKCAYYVPPTSNTLLGNTNTTQNNASTQLLNALSGNSSLNSALGGSDGGLQNVSDLLNANTNTNTNENTNANASGNAGAQQTSGGANGQPPVQSGVVNNQVALQPGARGDIQITNGGATVVANTRDVQGNTEVAGFYGSDTMGQPQGIVAGLCQARPWANAVVSLLIPPSFFDSLCTWRGYQVGVTLPPAAQAPVVQQVVRIQPPAKQQQQQAAPPTTTVPPQADIWAVPPSVPLGARTSIFWNAKGVASCTETSPDGSFNQSTLSGGASTVPLSGATTFTISCLTEDGKPITNYVTVNMSI